MIVRLAVAAAVAASLLPGAAQAAGNRGPEASAICLDLNRMNLPVKHCFFS